MGYLVAAPDKFRGTAEAAQAAAAAARGARRAGWTAYEIPLADGGDGLLSAFTGELMRDEVTGPLGTPVLAEWKLIEPRSGHDGLTAIIEMANASGLLIAGGESGNDPVGATTEGTGQLVMRAVSLGARRVIVGCGGSATTDGGAGALKAIGSPKALRGTELVAASDVTTRFLDAARVFGPQKGATPEQVEQLTARLERLAENYRRDFGVEVASLPGAGAAGGLAGGLAALGAKIVSGFEFVAEFVGLDEHLDGADVVMTGEGFLDSQSFSGKVVGGVISHVAGRMPILCVAGDVAPDLDPAGMEIVSLVARAGPEKARSEVLALIEEVVAEHISLRA
ncbi:MAG: glycerate kinase [Acidimicrobiales bacterium]|jgi:glycerate kinase